MQIGRFANLLRLCVAMLLVGTVLAAPLGAGAAPRPRVERSLASPALDAEPQSVEPQAGLTTLTFPAQALNYNPGLGVVTSDGYGLVWRDTGGEGSAALLSLPRPENYNPSSAVYLSIYFSVAYDSTSSIDFDIYPISYDPGDPYGRPWPITSSAVLADGDVFLKQQFVIPASRLQKELWVIGIERADDTYEEVVTVYTVGIRYLEAVSTRGSEGYPANALNYNPSLNTVKPWSKDNLIGVGFGTASLGGAAFLNIARPSDWNGSGSVTLRLYYLPTTSDKGKIDMEIRPRGYSAGDTYGSDPALNSEGVAAVIDEVLCQSFTISAAHFGSKDLWVIGIQRGGPGETYAGRVVLLAVGISYTAKAVTAGGIDLPADAINYGTASGVIAPDGGGLYAGLSWEADSSSVAFIDLARPVDWDGVNPVTVRLYYMPMTDTGGTAKFTARASGFGVGDEWPIGQSYSGDAQPMAGTYVLVRQTIEIPASAFGKKEGWMIGLSRSSGTHPDDVILLSVEFTYRATQRVYLPLMRRG